MEYTKGKWILSEDGMTVETAHAPNGHVIAMMNGIGDKVQADAHLITQAPRLYEACCSALVEIEDGSANHAHLILSQAIEKVKS